MFNENLEVIESYLRKFCEEDILEKVEVPKKVLVRKPNRRIVTNGMNINEIMRLQEYSVKIAYLMHNLEIENKKKTKDYILMLLDFSDDFLMENVSEIKASLPVFFSNELKSYIIKYIDLRIKVFVQKNGELNYTKQKVLNKKKSEIFFSDFILR